MGQVCDIPNGEHAFCRHIVAQCASLVLMKPRTRCFFEDPEGLISAAYMEDESDSRALCNWSCRGEESRVLWSLLDNPSPSSKNDGVPRRAHFPASTKDLSQCCLDVGLLSFTL
jgi:hypothetical protein